MKWELRRLPGQDEIRSGILDGVDTLSLSSIPGRGCISLAGSGSDQVKEGAPWTLTLGQASLCNRRSSWLYVCWLPLVPARNNVQAPPTPPNPGSPQMGGPASCSPLHEWCRGSCVDRSQLMSDDNNCGRCGNSCRIGSESCMGGSCDCAGGYTRCRGECVGSFSFSSDNFNCGSCGNSCSIGESCFGGTCHKNT